MADPAGGDSGVIGDDDLVVIAPGDQPPRDEFGLDWSALPVDRGDVVRISCPPAEAEVVELATGAVIVRWPWPDPEFDTDEDAGLLAVFTDRAKRTATLWRYDPDPADRQLAVGDRIQVSIPGCVVNVNYTDVHFHPAPSSIDQIAAGTFSSDGYDEVRMGVLPYGVSECRATVENPDQRIMVGLYGPEPVTVRLVHRPYAWLVDGDQVLDPEANRWSFYKPLSWVELGNAEPGAPLQAPQWPLHLVERYSATPTAEEQAAVTAGSATGSHDDEVSGWRAASGAALIPSEHEGGHNWLPVLDEAGRARVVATVRAGVRAKLLGCSSEKILLALREAEHWYHQVSKIVLNDEDELRVETESIRIDEIKSVLSWLLNHPTADHYNGETIPGDV